MKIIIPTPFHILCLLIFTVGMICCKQTGMGPLDVNWIHGSLNCNENQDEPIQIVQYNPSTFLLRQNKCINYEAPFMFLFFGNDKALLVDTGATSDSTTFPLRGKIQSLIKDWQNQRGKTIELVVAHSHSHGDHYAADGQFRNMYNTKLVGLRLDEIKEFFGFSSWPEEQAVVDLGGRKLMVIPIPGHDEMSIAIYDEQTQLLLTGDSFYPGRLYIRDWDAFRASVSRLNEFVKTHAVKWILGNHNEMKDSVGIDYPVGTTYQPHEQAWPLTVEELNFLDEEMVKLSSPVRKVYDKFILEPVASIREVPIDEASIHTITLEGYPDFLAADGDDVWVTNVDHMEKLSMKSDRPVMRASVPGNCGAPVVAYGSLWVASCKEKAVIRIDASNGKLISKINCGLADLDGELSLAVGDDAIWVLSDAKGVLSRIDVNTNKVVAQIQVKPESYCAAFGFGSVWITNTMDSSVQRIDPATNKVIANIPVGGTPRFLTAGEGGVWTLNQKDGTVSMIDPEKNEVMATIQTHVPGGGGDIASGGGSVWVRATRNRMLQMIQPQTGKVLRIYTPLNGSGAVRVAGEHVWVTAHDVNKIWVLR